LSEYFLPLVADSKRIAVLSTMEIRQFSRWALLEAGWRADSVEFDWRSAATRGLPTRQAFSAWLRDTRCEKLVFIDVPATTYLYELTSEPREVAAELPPLLAEQTDFRLVHRRIFSLYWGTVSVYERARPAPAEITSRVGKAGVYPRRGSGFS
jgi:hypothetical protein